MEEYKELKWHIKVHNQGSNTHDLLPKMYYMRYIKYRVKIKSNAITGNWCVWCPHE